MTDLKSVFFPVSAGICALAFLYKARDLRPGRRDPALIALLIAFLFKGVSFTLSTAVVSAAVDKYSGVPNLGALGIHLSGGVTSSAAFLSALVLWVCPAEQAWPKVRRRILLFGLVGAVMFVLWYAASSGAQERSPHYLLQNAHRPVVAAYLLLYVTAFAAGMAEIVRLCRRYAKSAGRAWLRRGLWTMSVGATIYIAYCVNRAWAVIAVQLELNPLQWELVTPLSNGIGILLVATGFTMPSWGPRLSAARLWVSNYRAFQRLHPLWSDLYRAVPEIALSPPAPSLVERFRPGDLRYRLYRRVIEIRDGLLAMRPYMPADAVDASSAAAPAEADSGGPGGAGAAAQAQRASAEAARLAAALGAKSGREAAPAPHGPTEQPASSPPAAAEPPASPPPCPGPPSDGDACTSPTGIRDDYAGELGWLLQLAKAYSGIRHGRDRDRVRPGEDQEEVADEVPSAR